MAASYTAANANVFDVCAIDGTHVALACFSATAGVQCIRLDDAGTITNVASEAGTPLTISVNANAASHVGVAWTESAACYYETWNGAAGWPTVIAKTTVGSLASFSEAVIGYDSNLGRWIVLVNEIGSSGHYAVNVQRSDGSTYVYAHDWRAVSKPFVLGFGCYAWIVDGSSYHNEGCTARLMDVGRSGSYDSGMPRYEAVAVQLECSHGFTGLIPGYYGLNNSCRSVAVIASTEFPGLYRAYTCLPVAIGTVIGADGLSVESTAGLDKLASVHVNGQTILSGPMLREITGGQVIESGMWSGPQSATATAGTLTGGVDPGAHGWITIWEWTDAEGRMHRSAPSIPTLATVVSGSESIALTWRAPTTTARTGIRAKVYRTLVGGTVYYLTGTVIPAIDSSSVTYTDIIPDGTIAVNETLYTQGDRGAISGLLPNDEPPPAKYLWAGNDRVLAGGLEDPTAVQWSKLVYPGEGLSWTINPGHRANVDGEVTAVACLDGNWLVFTSSSVWCVTGDGPDDTGNGWFDSPRRLPGDVGCISHRSIVETAQGLMFQGSNGGIWLLPRGGSSPQWIGQPVRATLTTYPLITAVANVQAENCIYWACSNAAATAGVMVVYDTRLGEWYEDTITAYRPAALAVHNGKLLLNGAIEQTPGVYFDRTGTGDPWEVPYEIITGDIRPFGPSGWGRVRQFALLGEMVTSGTATIRISYDSGLSWTDTYSCYWATGIANDPVRYEFGPSQVRGCEYRIKIDVTGGLALNSLSLEVFKAAALRRLAVGNRG